MQNIIKISSLE